MASAFFRGPKSSPRWFARYRTEGGIWRSKRVRVETRRDALAIARQIEAQAERRKYGLEAPESARLLAGDLMRRWENGLVNRSAYDDRSRLRLHVLPRFGTMRLADLGLPVLMQWLDELRAASQVAPATQRHLLNLVSRFFGWAIERGFATVNPVRQIPAGKRPAHSPKRSNVEWIADDDQVRAIMRELPEPFRQMFFVGNRAGMRLGEICGLRMSDVEELTAGAFRVRYSYAGPLKEDKAGAGKVKWTPAPADALDVLGAWIARRRTEGAGPEAFLFEARFGRHFRKDAVSYQWAKATAALGLKMTWYAATRHSFASRNIAAGVPVDQVSAALGHSSVAITQKHYDHVIRRVFSPTMTAALAPEGKPSAPVIPLGRRPAVSTPSAEPAPAAATVRRDGAKGAGHAA